MDSVTAYELSKISWAMSESVREGIWAWRGIGGGKKNMSLIPFAIVWMV